MAGLNYVDLCLKVMQSNPQIANTPRGQEFVKILQSGDTNAGIQMANEILQSLGTTREGFFSSLQNQLSRRS